MSEGGEGRRAATAGTVSRKGLHAGTLVHSGSGWETGHGSRDRSKVVAVTPASRW